MSSVLAQGRKSDAGSIRRVSASEIEAVVVQGLRAAYPDDADLDERALIHARVDRIVLRAGSIDIHPCSDSALMRLAWFPAATVRKREILRSSEADGH